MITNCKGSLSSSTPKDFDVSVSFLNNIRTSNSETEGGPDVLDCAFIRIGRDIITYRMLKEVCDCPLCNECYYEHISARSFSGGNVVVSMNTFSGQTGCVFVYDLKNHLFVHAVETNYAMTSSIKDNYVYTLHYIGFWGHPCTLNVSRCKFGTYGNCFDEIIEVADHEQTLSCQSYDLKVVNDIMCCVVDDKLIDVESLFE